VFSCCTVWFLPESPIFLLKSGKFDELKEALTSIANWNGVIIDLGSLEFSDSVSKKEEKGHSGRRPDKAENVMRV